MGNSDSNKGSASAVKPAGVTAPGAAKNAARSKESLEKENEELPCHAIPLNAAGDTVESLEGNEAKLEQVLKEWMRAKIKEIEAERNKIEAPSPFGRGLG